MSHSRECLSRLCRSRLCRSSLCRSRSRPCTLYFLTFLVHYTLLKPAKILFQKKKEKIWIKITKRNEAKRTQKKRKETINNFFISRNEAKRKQNGLCFTLFLFEAKECKKQWKSALWQTGWQTLHDTKYSFLLSWVHWQEPVMSLLTG